ncbi:MAG: hypothetical protein ABI723_05115 [Bacteroidia bacterium]
MNVRIIFFVLIMALTTNLYAQQHFPEVDIIIIKNTDTISISNNDVIKFIYKNDTIVKSISRGKLLIDTTLFIRPILALQINAGVDILELPYLTDSMNYFKKRFVLDWDVPKKFVFDYYTNYQLAKNTYGHYVTDSNIEEDKFKSVIFGVVTGAQVKMSFFKLNSFSYSLLFANQIFLKCSMELKSL